MELVIEPWIWWAVTAVAFFIIEMVTPGFFFFICFALAATIACAASALGLAGLPVWTTFLVSALVFVLVARPIFTKYISSESHPSNVDEAIGKEAIVLETVKPNQSGLIKVGSETWRARAAEEIAAGALAIVRRVEGNHLFIEPKR